MKRLIALMLILSLSLGALIGCQQSPPTDDNVDPPKTDGTAPEGDGDGEGADKITDEEKLFEALFNPENHIAISIDISDNELKKLQEDYEKYSAFGSKSPIYRMADMRVAITTPDGKTDEYAIPEVGVRMKGNTSRTSFYSDEEGMYNLIHLKISFGETFDKEKYYGSDALVWDEAARKERKDRTFATLEKIDIKWNRNDDTTYIRESYEYDIYREAGLLAPHTTLASVDIGKEHAGVWTVYEPIDDIFLEKNLPAAALGGDLYKLGWTYEGATFTSFHSYGVEDEDNGEFFIYDLKTNKKTSTHESLKRLIEALNSTGLNKESFGEVMDIDSFLKYAAISYMIGNPDDLRNNYNNSYIYFMADTGRAVIIPYDLDRGLGVNKWNPYGDGMTTDSPFSENTVQGYQRNPMFLKTVSEYGFLVDEYVSALKMASESPLLTDSAFASRYELARNLYSQDAKPSKVYKNAESYKFTFDISVSAQASEDANMSFSDYIAAKKATLDSAISEYESQPDKPSPIGVKAYIRADFTDWNISDGYEMTLTDGGVFVIQLERDGEFRFKVYDYISDKWYGSEVVAEDTAVEFTTDSHTNIVLAKGRYTVTFDTTNNTIYLTEE